MRELEYAEAYLKVLRGTEDRFQSVLERTRRNLVVGIKLEPPAFDNYRGYRMTTAVREELGSVKGQKKPRINWKESAFCDELPQKFKNKEIQQMKEKLSNSLGREGEE